MGKKHSRQGYSSWPKSIHKQNFSLLAIEKSKNGKSSWNTKFAMFVGHLKIASEFKIMRIVNIISDDLFFSPEYNK